MTFRIAAVSAIFDAEELSNDTSEVTLDEAEPIDYGFDVERFSSSDGVEENTTDVIAQVVDEEV